MGLSVRRLGANRLNAQLSTGPRTKEGKERVRFNAIKHGLLARAAVIPGEDWKKFKALLRTFRRELRPKGLEEELLVEQICVLYTGLARATHYESGLIAKQTSEAEEEFVEDEGEDEDGEKPTLGEVDRAALAMPVHSDDVTHLLRYENARRRELNKALDRLRRLQRGRQVDKGTPEER